MIKRIIFLKILLVTALISEDSFLKSIYSNKDFKLLLKKDIELGGTCAYDEPCIYVNDEYLKIEMNLLNFILKEGGYKKPSKKKFLIDINKTFNISPKNKITTLRKEYLYRDYKSPYKFIPFLNRSHYLIDNIDEGTDRIILMDERFMTFAFRISELVDSFQIKGKQSKVYKHNPAQFIISINKYLFNDDNAQFKVLISKNFITLEKFDLLKVVVNKASGINKVYFLKYLKNKQNKKEYTYWLEYLHYNLAYINTPTHKSLYSFCKSTGIKESEIRALNPWINKKATNIPPNTEIIIPNMNKE